MKVRQRERVGVRVRHSEREQVFKAKGFVVNINPLPLGEGWGEGQNGPVRSIRKPLS